LKIEIDLDSLSYSQLRPIIEYVVQCPFSRNVRYRTSSSLDGYHLKFDCAALGCDFCKRKWDDWKHYYEQRWGDSNSPLFSKKVYVKGGHTLVLRSSEWIWVKYT
jgi:hypothetical protein